MGDQEAVKLSTRALAGRGVPSAEASHRKGPFLYVLDEQAPRACSAHGLPESRRVKMMVRTKPSASRAPGRRFSITANIFSTAAGVSEDSQHAVLVKARWPLCRQCDLRRRVYFGSFLLMLASGLLALIAVVLIRATGDASPSLIWPFLIGLALLLGSVVPFVLGSLPRLTGTHAATDGSGLIVEHPDPKFIDALAIRTC
ncbi:hypothetical protein [Rhodococcus oryzae]|uniref:hypothetical protein n=1 Tax=Rhodococcus oryzae TaxID=2571143 RepID=UPI0037B7C705